MEVYSEMLIEYMTKVFPGGPVVQTLCFHFRGHRFDPWSKTRILQILHAMGHRQKTNKTKRLHEQKHSETTDLKSKLTRQSDPTV